MNQQDFYSVLDYESEGIYLVNVGPVGEAARGLWLLKPSSGSVRTIVAPADTPGEPIGFYLIGDGGAWYGDVASPNEPSVGGIGAMDEVVRFDLTTHVKTPWLHMPGWELEAIGFDGTGHVIVMATTAMYGVAVQPGQGTLELWIVDAPGKARKIYSTATSPNFVGSFGYPLADDHGVWFGSSSGVFLYTADGTFQRVSNVSGEVAGRCS